MGMVLICSMACSWVAVKIEQGKRQREAVNVFRRFPGIITYDYQHHGQPGPANRPWSCRLLGDDLAANIDFVCLGCDKRFTDDTLAHVESLPRLRVLRIGGAAVTDCGLRRLKTLTRLEYLSLARTKVTDSGLDCLAEMPSLHEVNLHGSGVTLDGVKKLRKAMPNCKVSWEPPKADR